MLYVVNYSPGPPPFRQVKNPKLLGNFHRHGSDKEEEKTKKIFLVESRAGASTIGIRSIMALASGDFADCPSRPPALITARDLPAPRFGVGGRIPICCNCQGGRRWRISTSLSSARDRRALVWPVSPPGCRVCTSLCWTPELWTAKCLKRQALYRPFLRRLVMRSGRRHLRCLES